ncbi:MAG TPA: hypothetical protein VFL80_11125 [Thermoanaerobaculia bacterium]|nr:hypothetical protein [Thermoanaerobaculia bacterium]
MTTLAIEVCSRAEAAEILRSGESCAAIDLLISIGEWIDGPPPGYENVSARLRLTFADTADPERGPRERDVEKIIEAARQLSEDARRVVVHCQAGISRSAAAAMILYAAILGPGREDEAFRRVIEQRPVARPNIRMIEIADRLLGCDGEFVRVVRSFLENDAVRRPLH